MWGQDKQNGKHTTDEQQADGQSKREVQRTLMPSLERAWSLRALSPTAAR